MKYSARQCARASDQPALAGDDQRAAIVAVFDNLQQIAALLGGQRLGSPVVQNEQIDARELAHQPGVAAIASLIAGHVSLAHRRG